MSSLEERNDCGFCRGDGDCSVCSGTGRNPNADQPESRCTRCAGTGVCTQCLGSGTVRPLEPENWQQEIVQ